MRRLAFISLLLCLLLAACGGDKKSGSSSTSHATTSGAQVKNKQSASTGSAVTNAPATTDSRDGADPNESGCAKTAVNVPGRIKVRLKSGKKLGRLLLRRSTACETVWGRVVDIQKKGVDIHVDAVRPKDGAVAPFDTADGTKKKSVFGNMLSYANSCVYAKAYVEGGEIAKTKCYKK